ncbi:E3 ubiquitin-protein ligase hrd1 [Globomyces sp. JEL0801]|nr:E3 ubiquitin-protein ligase hrd1 [Globomyces sp. JEL0801]
MEQTPNLTYGFHLRMTSIMALFFMYAILASVMIASFAKYVMNTIEINRETPWEERTLYFLYVDLFLDFFKLISYLVFFAVVVNFYGIPLHIVRDVYLTFRSFIKRLYGLLRYREATANMNERYPTPTEDELNATDKVCIVCREEMCLPSVPPAPATPVTEIPKKLPCGHLFHFRCLRSWLERQQTCPTCRGNILESKAIKDLSLAPPPQPAAQNNGPNVNPNANAQPNAPVGGIMGIFRQLQDRGRAAAGLAQVPQQVVGPNIPAVGLPRNPVVPNPQQQELRAPNIPFGMPNGIQPLPNIVYPLTLTPLNSGNPTLPTTSLLSLEQLRGMEGSSRVAAATRLQELRNIRSQLDILCNRMEQVLMLMPNEEEIVLTAGSSLVEPEIDQ